MLRKISILYLVLCFIIISMAQAANDDKRYQSEEEEKKPDIHYKEEIVVTATMTEKMVKDCSASVSVITEKDIEASNVSNALNLLNFLPGIFVQRTGDFGRADVEMRGLGSRGRRIAIMVDGRPEKMGLYGCVVTHTFPLDNVARIEVVRGASSVLYGSDALGGVVNILTKKIERNFITDFTVSYGSYNTQQYLFRHGGNTGALNYYFTVDKRVSDGHLPNSSYNGQDFTGRVGYTLSDNIEITLQSKYFSGKKYEPGTELYPLSDYWNDYKRGAVDFTISGEWQKSEAYLKIYRNFGHHQFSDGWHSKDYTNGGVLRYTSHALINNELTVGVDFRGFGGERLSIPQGEWNKSEYAVFVQNEHILFNKLILSTGARMNRDSIYGSEFCPHLGVVFHLRNSTHFRAAINKGFRSPQLNELYMLPTSNPTLKPEKVWNYELGVSHEFFSWLSSDFVIYTMKGENLVEMRPNPSAPPEFMFFNVGSFNFKGSEIGVTIHARENLRGEVYYTYLDPEEHTRGRAKHKLDFIVNYNWEKLFFSFNIQSISGYYSSNNHQAPLSGYLIAHSKINYHISPNLNIFLAVNNILNEEYKIFVDLPGIAAGAYSMPGRAFTFGSSLNF